METQTLPGRTATVTLGAVVKRINRKLKPDWKQLKKTRGYWMRVNLGDYYVLDTYNNNILTNVYADPETLGRELGVIANWETVVGAEAA